jgi:hypothetical protein
LVSKRWGFFAYNGVATSASASVFGSRRERDVNTHGLESEELVDDNMIIDEHDAVLLIRSIAVEIPAGSHGLLMEGSEDGLLDVVSDGQVILDSIKAAKGSIGETYLSRGPTVYA